MERPLTSRPVTPVTMPGVIRTPARPPAIGARRTPGPARSPAGRAAEYFELLLEDAAVIEYERPLVRARAAGAHGDELA